MNWIARRLAGLPSIIGWTGGIGAALLVSALVLGMTLLLPARDEGERFSEELQQLRRKSAAADPAAPPASALRRQLDEFASSLPGQEKVNAQLTQLYDLATRNHLTLRNGEYRTTTNKGGRISRLQITVRSEGNYTDFRRFLREIPAALPALSVSRFSITRQKPADVALETTVEFALFYTKTET